MFLISFPSGVLVFGILLLFSWMESYYMGEGKHIASVAFILISWALFSIAGYWQWFLRRRHKENHAL